MPGQDGNDVTQSKTMPAPAVDAHRVFFALAAVAAALAIPSWLAVRGGALPVPAHAASPVAWHAQEMLFGFAAAIIAGYLLPVLSRGALALLCASWLLARVLGFVPGVPAVVHGLGAAAFPVCVAVLGAARFQPARRLRNKVLPLILFGVALAALLGPGGAGRWLGLDAHVVAVLPLCFVILLVFIMGGRLIPTATIGALRDAGRIVEIRAQPRRESIGVSLVVALLAGLLAGFAPLAGAAGLLLAALVGVRMKDWQSRHVWHLPGIWPLHAGYLWLGVGMLLLGLSVPGGAALRIAAWHALGMGALGGVAAGVSSRLVLLRARAPQPGFLQAAFILLHLGVMLRLTASLRGEDPTLLWLAALPWSLAWLMLLCVYLVPRPA